MAETLNEYLERALEAYYRRHVRRNLGFFLACAFGLVVVVGWVLFTRPEKGWFSAPVALVGIPCAFGVLVLGFLMLMVRERPVLEHLRAGVRVKKVKRGVTVISKRPARPQLLENRVPTVFVEFDDGRASKLMSLGDIEQLTRLEQLLRKQMEMQHAR